MCQAALEGVIDFTQADPRDRRWWARLLLLLDRLEEKNVAAVLKLNHHETVAMLTRGDLSDQGLERLRDSADKQILGIKERLFPWVQFDKTTVTKQALEQMSSQWAREWGDPNDPATQAKIDATVAAMERQLVRSQGRQVA